MNFRIVLFAILCVSIMLLSGAQLSSSEWSQFHSEQVTLMQQQAQTLVRVDTLEKGLAEHEATQSGYPTTLALIEFKLDGIKSVFQWFIGLLAAFIVGGVGFFWRLLSHTRTINAKLDMAAGIAAERDVKHTDRERDIQLGKQHNDG